MKLYNKFQHAIMAANAQLKDYSQVVHTEKWQSVDISSKPEMATHEVLHHSFQVAVGSEDLDVLRKAIEPNLPWADDHFLERVGGEPLNPGVQWANWPYAHSADRFRTEEGQRFSHTYMERLWPKYAHGRAAQMAGIRYNYGDTGDVVEQLAALPLTRQAYLPLWFPEDTGKTDVRVPCTLGYHFIVRPYHAGLGLHCTYWIRSCDFLRHFRDDIYLTVRLQLWMLEQLRAHATQNIAWKDVKPALFTMHVTSLHLFRNDYLKLYGEPK